jgi:hypothetical protein
MAQRKQPYPITDLTGGINVGKDPIYIGDGESTNMRYCRFEGGVVYKDFGKSTFGTKVLGTPLLIKKYFQTDGDTYIMLLTTTSVYKWDTATTEWADLTPQQAICTCETAWTVPANVTASNPAGKVGTYCTKLAIGADYTTGVAGYFAISSLDMHTRTHVHLWIKSSIATASGDIRLLLDDTAACASPIENLSIPALVADTWTRASLTLAAAASDTAIISVGIRMQVDKGAMDIYVDNIIAVLEYTGDEDDGWSATTLNDTFIFTNGIDVMQKFDGSTVSNLGGTPPYAKSVNSFQNRLVVCGTVETGTAYPFRVRWSSAGTIETWTGGTSGYVDLVDTPDWAFAVELLKDSCYVYKESSIWELTYIGGTGIFLPKMRSSVNGTVSPRSIQCIKDLHYFVSSDAIYTFDGLNLNAMDTKLYPMMYKASERIRSLTYPKRVCSSYFEQIGEYWVCIPTVSSPDVPETMLKRSKEGSWVREGGQYITCFGLFQDSAVAILWSTAVGSWAASPYGSWRRRTLEGTTPTLLIGWYDGQIYQDDRTTSSSDTMVFETKDFLYGHAHRNIEVRILYKKGPCTIYYSLDGGTTYTSLGDLPYVDDWTEGVKYLNVTTMRIRFKIEVTTSEFELKWMEPWYIPRQRSKTLTTA